MEVSGNLNGLLYEILPLKLMVFILGVSKTTKQSTTHSLTSTDHEGGRVNGTNKRKKYTGLSLNYKVHVVVSISIEMGHRWPLDKSPK